MVRTRMLFTTARENSATTSHQNPRDTGWWAETAWTMPSIISFVIQSSATGIKDDKSREISPKTTTAGPESHTILRTAGTLRSAEMRSCHPPQKFWRSVMPAICRLQADSIAGWTKLRKIVPWSMTVSPLGMQRPTHKMPKPHAGFVHDGLWSPGVYEWRCQAMADVRLWQ